jgi:hypothetical protein
VCSISGKLKRKFTRGDTMKLWIISGVAFVMLMLLVMPVVACDFPDCPLTQGYWKNHPGDWPYLEKFDYGTFYKSGDDYMCVLETPTKGNAYYILAHQFIAARLNGAPWTTPDEVDKVWWEAWELFCTYSPCEIAEMKGSDPVRKKFICLADILDKYNNGCYS